MLGQGNHTQERTGSTCSHHSDGVLVRVEENTHKLIGLEENTIVRGLGPD